MTKVVEGSKPRETVPAPKSADMPDPDVYRRAVEDAAKSAPPPKAKAAPRPKSEE